MYKKVPIYKDDKLDYKEFKEKEDFTNFILTLFKEPGQYQFDETALLFNEQATIFNDQGFYCDKPLRSKDFMSYWEDQKKKCRDGVIFKSNKNTLKCLKTTKNY